MALGLSRDSFLNLAELAHASEQGDHKHDFDYLTTEEGESSEIALDSEMTDDDENLIDTVIQPFPATDEEVPIPAKATIITRAEESSKETAKKESPSRYFGFTLEGYDTDYTSYDPYAELSKEREESNSNLLCCLFPWAAGPQTAAAMGKVNSLGDTQLENSEVVVSPEERPNNGAGVSDDENSTGTTGSEVLGEKLTDKDRLAVMARLRLSDPEGMINNALDVEKVIAATGSTRVTTELRGILKHAPGTRSARDVRDSKSDDGSARRALFPVYEDKTIKKVDTRHIHFAPMARVVTVKSHKSMVQDEKSSVWWQRRDYDDFKKTGRLVARAMLQYGSEVWLMTNPSWREPGSKGSAAVTPNEKKDPNPDNKWWHKFGHSRRGLEHIASTDEGKQRQLNVRVAVRAVLDEQRKQKIHRKNDIDRIRSTYVQFNAWAKELSRASGASDEEAVQMNFCETRKSREYYIIMHCAKDGRVAPGHVPDFMKSTGKYVTQQMLDANTKSNVRRRKTALPLSTDSSHHSTSSRESISKKAAGYMPGDDHVSMSAVLSGMGAMGDKTPPSVRAN